ncbi:E3 ubiquitin-protein ligase TM129 isoform X2 [Dermochelys coriacea]|uniref:E3 ubiquitin-protein ligase TM129 isoform X2 n=1 Tax=Dermochelys coriacea TaxID=27794 RepID=UPI001CA9F009|nr:E3 ubiquitin-protein ligase TM129 isoform X2 [Dermochelys coriacea]
MQSPAAPLLVGSTSATWLRSRLRVQGSRRGGWDPDSRTRKPSWRWRRAGKAARGPGTGPQAAGASPCFAARRTVPRRLRWGLVSPLGGGRAGDRRLLSRRTTSSAPGAGAGAGAGRGRTRSRVWSGPGRGHGQPRRDLHAGLPGVRRLLRVHPQRVPLGRAHRAEPAGRLAGQRGRGLRPLPPAEEHGHHAGPRPAAARLNSSEYGELREKLHAPIRNAANVVIHQSLSDLFLETFTLLVEINQTYPVPSNQELEPCIGCMQTNANIKLVKNCQEPNEGECQQCYCRPMWCLTCMGKWFASRQDQQHPETWLSSQVPCPTCRAKFCILDVCIIQ